MTDLEALQQAVLKFRDDRDWKQFHNPKDCAISLSLEASEFLELFQWKNAEEIEQMLQSKRVDVEDELADVLYWVLLLAYDLNVNLSDALRAKIEKTEKKYPIEKAKGRHSKYTEYQDEESL